MSPSPSTAKHTVLTGITTTGTPHLGNYAGAIKPAIQASKNADANAFYFLADFHALIKCHDPKLLQQSTLEIAATWLALGLDTERAVFYRQSDIAEIPELTWFLTCMTAKGLMNRAHAYKAAVQENEQEEGLDPDRGITMGLFSYPVLMAADILMFNANKVPVGKDQVQHIEMARDIAQRFNHHFGEHFVLPEAVVDDSRAVLPGLDGRKMSKSYGNTIPLWLPEKKFRKAIMKIKTNSKEPGEPKFEDETALFPIYKAFATDSEYESFKQALAEGLSWGEAKQQLFEKLNHELAEPRARYEALILDPSKIEASLQQGAEKARAFSQPLMQALKQAVGITPLR